ncbi:hypothetical protein BDV25DRAFT_140379 [Aspergillus avenaceus]|uniref:Uncharacterized protein n=1 Tax=Aspergillus avenaceus TaxID=36643 RepID=A0A5N6TUV4_ASPAV|nr:hypothetical protein BDV25DRAFT_140379 [Aspergillus avenaceus]
MQTTQPLLPAGNSTPSSAAGNSAGKYPIRQYLSRTIILLLLPPLVATYFLLIWLLCLRRGNNPVKYGHVGEVWVYYSWFVIGVFGLGWSKHGLGGVEMAMLQSRFFRARDTVTLIAHGSRGKKTQIHRLWYLLASLSALILIALPISGLCLELADGYVASSAHPMVIGRKWVDFNRRQDKQTLTRGLGRWKAGSLGQVPGIGVLYTPSYVDRNSIHGLNRLPNAFPTDGRVPDLFLAPQARVPISGRVWGLRLGCNCSIVTDASQFTIVSQRSQAEVGGKLNNNQFSALALETPSGDTILVYNSSSVSQTEGNLFAYVEMGLGSLNPSVYDGTEPDAFDVNDVTKADVLELAIWQARKVARYNADNEEGFEFDETIDKRVQGMGQPIIQLANGSYEQNNAFFSVANKSDTTLKDWATTSFQDLKALAPPIGVRCTSMSVLGFANIDARRSTFHSFSRSSPPPFNQSVMEERTPRFGYTASYIVREQYSNFWASINSPTPKTVSNSVYYSGFLQANDLQESIMLAYGMDAIQLMYDGVDSFASAYPDVNLTSSKASKVLVPGVVPPAIPAVLFIIWAATCVVLGAVYGFRPRWSDTLDSYSLFRFGVNLAASIGDDAKLPEQSDMGSCLALDALPEPFQTPRYMKTGCV